MKAISLKQPWASLVVLGAKRFETRSWKTEYRGPLLIHASKGYPQTLQDLARTEPFCTALGFHERWNGTPESLALPLGAVLGVVDVVKCWKVMDTTGFPMERRPVAVLETKTEQWPEGCVCQAKDDEVTFGDYSPGRYAWELANPRRFEQPIPFPGHLGLWEFPDALLPKEAR